MAPEPAPERPLIKKRPLKPPQPRPAAASYTEPPRAKNETFVALPGSKPVVFREVFLSKLPQPFVNPGDAFDHLKSEKS